jgi:hypothetical protein
MSGTGEMENEALINLPLNGERQHRNWLKFDTGTIAVNGGSPCGSVVTTTSKNRSTHGAYRCRYSG